VIFGRGEKIDSPCERVLGCAGLEEVAIDNLSERIRRRGVVRTYTEYALAWAILKGVGLLPRSWAVRMGRGVGAVMKRIIPRLSRHAEVNLQLAFPALNEPARQRIIDGVFSSLGRLLGEVSQFPRLTPENISRVVTYEGLENFLAARAAGRGVLLLTGHIGAWELSVFAHSLYGHPMSFLARRVDNPLVERLAESYRTRYGNRSIDKRGSVREVLRVLKSGGVVGILADLNASREEGVFVDFFGLQASTTAGVATLALRTGAAVVPGYILWDEAAQIHRLHFEPAIETIETGDQKADVTANTARYVQVLEAIIRRHPEQWLWIHRRFRTRPEGEREIY
jgi:KDO2-lipid IV(A) lauroyltransferase